MELKYVYINQSSQFNGFTSGRVYSVWVVSDWEFRIRDDFNHLVNVFYDEFEAYFISIDDYRNLKLERIGI
jgi:hypothetical protein